MVMLAKKLCCIAVSLKTMQNTRTRHTYPLAHKQALLLMRSRKQSVHYQLKRQSTETEESRQAKPTPVKKAGKVAAEVKHWRCYFAIRARNLLCRAGPKMHMRKLTADILILLLAKYKNSVLQELLQNMSSCSANTRNVMCHTRIVLLTVPKSS